MRFLNIFNRKETCHSELVSESKTKLVILNECEESKTNKGCFADAQHDVKCLNKKVAFTLAEVLITLTILGVVAALTIPSVMRTQNEVAERTKLKKAIVDYEKLIPNMTIENNLTSIEALKNYANKDNCVKSRTYFKIKQDDTNETPNNCIFQTSNGVWWNVTDITRPVISTKGVENLSTADGENSFLLSTTYSDTARAFVVNDLNTLTEPDKSNVQKTLAFTKIIKDDDKVDVSKQNPFSICNGMENGATCTVNKKDYIVKKISRSDISTCEEGLTMWRYTFNISQEICNELPTTIFIEKDPMPISEDDAKNCLGSTYSGCATEGDYINAAKRSCGENAHLATFAEIAATGYYSSYDEKYWLSDAPNDERAMSSLNNSLQTYILEKSFPAPTSISNSSSSIKAVCIGN